MQHGMKTALFAGVALFIGLNSASADPLKAEVMHWWTNGSEAAALGKIVEGYNAAGGQWVDHAVPDFESAIAAATSAIIGGSPPSALQFNAGSQFADLAQQGYLTDLSGYADAGNWSEALPKVILDAVTLDGKVYAIPVDNHGESWLWTSKAAFAKAGMSEPQTWEEFFPALDKLKASGIVPIAQGGESWQEIELFYSFMLFRGNTELYKALFVDGDEKVVQSAEFRAFADDFKKLSDYIDPGSPGRKWNDATAMVIQGKAAMQFMGDWAKGEFTHAGLKPETDFGCLLGFGGKNHFVVSSDVFVLPKSAAAGSEAAHKLLIETMMSPTVQAEFSKLKGSIPARLDADVSGLDACAIKGHAAMQDSAAQIAGPEISASADRVGAIQDAVSQFWNTPTMGSDEFMSSLVQALQATKQ